MFLLLNWFAEKIKNKTTGSSGMMSRPGSACIGSLAIDKRTSPSIGENLRFSMPMVLILWAATVNPVLAQPLIEEEQRLDFGVLAITANTSISRLSLPRTGNAPTIEGQFVLIENGTPGRYRFSGFPANTPLTVSLQDTTLSAGSNGTVEQLNVDEYDFPQLITDALGEAVLLLGARLNTSGNGGSYVDAPYSGTTVLRVDYLQPTVQRFVSNSKVIDIDTELRSTLTIDEEQPLDFGTLFARTSSTGQAQLTVSPSGTYTISEAGNSRFIPLANPAAGIFRVSGAAPSFIVSIAAQSADVLLEHTQTPGSSPHFILSDLVTSPEVTGTVDENGELLVQLGGTLKTELTASPQTYPSGQYEGTYRLTVTY